MDVYTKHNTVYAVCQSVCCAGLSRSQRLLHIARAVTSCVGAAAAMLTIYWQCDLCVREVDLKQSAVCRTHNTRARRRAFIRISVRFGRTDDAPRCTFSA